jgi:CRISPR system Cascade subunit CasE
MDLKYRNSYKSVPELERPPIAQLVEEGGIKWLSMRSERNGFSFLAEEVRIEGYSQYQVAKKGCRTAIRYSTLDFTGLLTVEDISLFQQALCEGIGPAKAFGCGLLLLRRL